jgi:hypothetical protein
MNGVVRGSARDMMARTSEVACEAETLEISKDGAERPLALRFA